MQVPWPSKKPQPEILTFRQPAVYNSATKHTEFYAQPPHRAAHELQRRAGRHPTSLIPPQRPPAEAVPLDLCNEQRALRRGYA